ncbi:MAG TPA: M28 family peptidase [Phycisphaerales bacterium]|nr:M28 family peptidase [Phycisphaerales bacterium]
MRPWRSSVVVLAAVVSLAGVGAGLPAMPRGGSGTGSGNVEPSPAEVLADDAKVWRQHVTTLSNPFLEGRAPDTKGNRIAADYIQWNYERLGLGPAFPTEVKGKDGEVTLRPFTSYRQEFKAPASQRPEFRYKLVEQAASYQVRRNRTELIGGEDFNVIGHSGSGEVTGAVVFCGYSLDDEEKEYYSYPPKTDLTGKIAMILRFEPMDEQGKSRWSEDEDQPWTRATRLEPKFREAIYHNAAAIVLVNPPGVADDRADKLEGIQFSGAQQQKVPVIMMSRAAAEAFVKKADPKGRSLMELRRLADKQGGVVPFRDNVKLSIKAKVEKPIITTDNVGAILPGKGRLADEYIVIGSHYDHVGYGYFGSLDNSRGRIHAGADDNASGTSGNLLVAKKLVEAYRNLPDNAEARSVLFMAFSAEESGLVGSAYYTRHLIAPVEKHYLMLNMDMIGRLRKKPPLEIGGVGSGVGLEDWIQPYLESSGMATKQSRIGAPNSDHASFHVKKIPNLFFFTGLHREYHTPADTVDTLNFEGAAQVADLVYRIALDAAQRTEPLPFSSGRDADENDEAESPPRVVPRDEPNRDDPRNPANQRARADEKPEAPAADAGDAPAPQPRSSRRVRMGIMPGNYGVEGEGVEVAGITDPESPAAKAGIREGDVLLKWDDHTLGRVEDLQERMTKAEPGQVVKITFRREGKEQTVEVTLAGAGERRPAPARP